MIVVLDTNIVVSRYISPAGTPAAVVASWLRGAFRAAFSEAILAEYQRALNYEHVRARHRLSADEIASDIADFRTVGMVVNPPERLDVIKEDPTDNKFLECAVAVGADFIVSGDKHLLALGEFRGIRIVSPAAFMILLNQRDSSERS